MPRWKYTRATSHYRSAASFRICMKAELYIYAMLILRILEPNLAASFSAALIY